MSVFATGSRGLATFDFVPRVAAADVASIVPEHRAKIVRMGTVDLELAQPAREGIAGLRRDMQPDFTFRWINVNSEFTFRRRLRAVE